MPDQFVVPQFLDVEAKIIGPITARQFSILLATLLAEFVIYRIFLSLIPLLGVGIPVLATGIVFAFGKVNGQPFHYIVLNMVQTLRKPHIRVWDKILSDSELRDRLRKEPEAPVVLAPRKARLEKSRLSELSLIANTGGVYQSDDVV